MPHPMLRAAPTPWTVVTQSSRPINLQILMNNKTENLLLMLLMAWGVGLMTYSLVQSHFGQQNQQVFATVSQQQDVSDTSEFKIRVNHKRFSHQQIAALKGEGTADAPEAYLVDALIDNELLHQYGIKQNIAAGDPVIRQRIVRLVLEESNAAIGVPDEKTLQAYYDSNKSHYTTPAMVRFMQIYIPAGGANSGQLQKLQRVLPQLTNTSAFIKHRQQLHHTLRAHNDASWYPYERLVALYGPSFADKMMVLTTESSPQILESSLGSHAVRILEAKSPMPRPYQEVADRVAREWRRQASEQNVRALLQKLRAQADIEVRD